jgi:cytochrome c
MKDPLFSNKVAAAVLTALLLIFGLPQLTAAIFGGGHHGGDGELHLAYGGDIQLETSGPVEEEPEVDLGTLLANASAAGGERRAALCKSCHTFEQGGANGTGPNLWNIVGSQVANTAGFNYTGALQELGGTWTYERLDGYLKNSQEYVPGTAMVQRFPRDDQRADLLAYLSTLTSGDPVPFPEPAPVAEESSDAGEEASETASEEMEDHGEDETAAEEAH